MIGYGRQSIDESDIAAVLQVLQSDHLTCGPAVAQFETAVAGRTGARHAVAVSNGTAALRLLYRVAGVGPGTRVGVPAITFVATASQALLLGAEVVLLDVDPQTMLLTPGILDRCTEPLDFVVPVHLAGRLCDLPGIAAVAAARGITVLEDAAHAFGSTRHDGHPCGDCTWSAGAAFSFHPVKNITTGEGGAITVTDPAWDRRLRSLRHHGIVRDGRRGPRAAAEGDAPWYHEFHDPATNERLCDIAAALGSSQCRRLQAFKAARQRIVDRYREACADLGWISLPSQPADHDPFWHLCIAHCDWSVAGADRQDLFAAARERGIALQVHYIPLHLQPLLAGASRAGPLSGTEAAYATAVSLPCHPGLGDADCARVIACLRAFGT